MSNVLKARCSAGSSALHDDVVLFQSDEHENERVIECKNKEEGPVEKLKLRISQFYPIVLISV